MKRIAWIWLLLNSPWAWSSDGCVDVTLGSVQLSVPLQHITPSTPRKSGSGNFIFAFDLSVPGVECPVGCEELFVNISSSSPTPEQNWIYREPKFTGRTSGKYHIYFDRFTYVPKPLEEILVPSDALRPQDEFYACLPEGRVENPHCIVTVVAKSGLVGQFWIPRKVLVRARDAAKLVTQSIDQFAENYSKGICK